MKKFAVIATLVALSGAAFAGTTRSASVLSASVTDPSSYSWEVAGVYNHALTDIVKAIDSPSIDTCGIDLTGIYHWKGNHKLTLRFGYAGGESDDYELDNFILMPGYRYEKPVNDKLTAYAGVGVGLGYSMLEYPGMDDYDKMANLVGNIEVGARYAITPRFDVVGSIMLNAGTSTFDNIDYEAGSEEQVNVSFRLGIGGKF